jgi:hypothetical protein
MQKTNHGKQDDKKQLVEERDAKDEAPEDRVRTSERATATTTKFNHQFRRFQTKIREIFKKLK